MSLQPGTRLGPYEVVAQIGVGGMGEVYRAIDTNLGRQVAIKVLPDAFAQDPERLARFEREAKTLASLNHPNIAIIHGLEKSQGMYALVMELVEGEDLSQRISHGPIPLDEALPIAKQIAEALEAAHEQGIIHRDLKPANIKVRPDGTVKVLDFGLAKLAESAGSPTSDASLSPTITSPAMMTGVGVLLGTAAYMSPEQARGRTVDRRADIWAFGCVMYEMLTGKRAFDGDDVAVVLASVIKSDPRWSALPPDLPPAVTVMLRSSLAKDPHERMGDMAAAAFLLNHAAEMTPPSAIAPTVAAPSVDGSWARWRIPSVVAVALLVGAAVAGGAVWWRMRAPTASVVRLTINTSGSSALVPQGSDVDVAITPDGSRIVYRGNNQLLVRALNQLEPTVLGDLGLGPSGVFVSPDGQWVGFFDGAGQLKKVAITGGPPVTLAQARGARGATWSEDGTIVFAAAVPGIGLERVPAAGGETVVVTKPAVNRGEGAHYWPEFLPGGQSVLYTIVPVNGNLDNAQIAVLDLQTGTSKVLVRGGSHARYVQSGHLVYGVVGTLLAATFDLRRLEVVGTPTPVVHGVSTTSFGAADAAMSATGSLIYVPGTAAGNGQLTVAAMDRRGVVSPLPGVPNGAYLNVRVSPDGTRLAIATNDDVWTYDLSRATLSRLTTNSAPDSRPLWTPDGQRVVYSSWRASYPEIFSRRADGTGSDERLLTRSKDLLDLRAEGWSADGKQMLISEIWPGAVQCAIEQIPVDRPTEVKVLVKNEFCNNFASISPDGRWMVYDSNVSGHYEVYVERYPELGNRQQISTGGGVRPLWSPEGRELFFLTPDYRQVFTVPVQSGSTITAGRPQPLFDANLIRSGGDRPYDVGRDDRFFVIRRAQSDSGNRAANMILVLNWQEELKRLVPAR